MSFIGRVCAVIANVLPAKFEDIENFEDCTTIGDATDVHENTLALESPLRMDVRKYLLSCSIDGMRTTEGGDPRI